MSDDAFLQGIEPEAEVVEQAPEGEAPAGEESEGGDPRKRRRRRGRRKKSGVAAGGEGEAPSAIGEGAESDADSEEVDNAPIENYSSLNMPSWQDLIDGLYKP